MSEETKKLEANVENREQQGQLTDEQLEQASAGADTRIGTLRSDGGTSEYQPGFRGGVFVEAGDFSG